MIAYDLQCVNGHTFEGWFEDRKAYLDQQRKDLITCPVCLDQISTDEQCHCQTCNSDFSVLTVNAVLVEHVGSIPKNEWIIQSD